MSKLVLIRHGQSIWNKENRFTGWVDVSLSTKGLAEARKAAMKLKNMKFNVAFTSNLLRAQETLFEILNRNSMSKHKRFGNTCEKGHFLVDTHNIHKQMNVLVPLN